jgi:hypothetical protein
MTVEDDVLRALRARADDMTDAELSALLGKGHQHINQTCRRLADQGRIVRGHNSERGIVNKVSIDAPSSPVMSPQRSLLRAADEEWEREERVQSRVVTHLATNVVDHPGRGHGSARSRRRHYRRARRPAAFGGSQGLAGYHIRTR